MIHYLFHHVTQALLLVIIFVTGILVFAQMDQIISRFGLLVVLAALYFVFGIFHHLEEKNLTTSIVAEYLIVSIMLLWAMLALSF